MFKYAILTASILSLSACLSTKEPVFDETNSAPVGEIPEFLAFADGWEAYVSKEGSPRELTEQGARGVVVDGIVIVQENSDYYALGMMGGRPLSCVIYADDGMEADAAKHGVTVEIEKRDASSRDDAPALVLADGPEKALVAFIRDQFSNQRLACIANPRGE